MSEILPPGTAGNAMREIRACDAAGHWFSYHAGGLDGGVYAEDDGEPIMRHPNIRDEAELRLAVESYRVALIVGERIGRTKQIAELHKALGIAPQAQPGQNDCNAPQQEKST